MSNYYKSNAEIEAVVQGFESCTTPASGFTHHSHLTVAVWYLSHGTTTETVQQMRDGIFRFLDHHQVSHAKYHETLTQFWTRLVRQCLDQLNPNCSLREAVNEVIEAVGNSQVVAEYYTSEQLWSDEARKTWVEPDLKQLKQPAVEKPDDANACAGRGLKY